MEGKKLWPKKNETKRNDTKHDKHNFNQLSQSIDHWVPFVWKSLFSIVTLFPFPSDVSTKCDYFFIQLLSTLTSNTRGECICACCFHVSHISRTYRIRRERERQFMYSCVFPNATWWLYASISFLLGVKAQRHKIAVMLLHVREQETILIDTEKQVSDMSIQSISHLVTFPLSFTLSQRFFRFITLPRPFSMLNIHIYSLERIRRGSQKMYIQPKTYKLCDFGWFVCAIWTIIS